MIFEPSKSFIRNPSHSLKKGGSGYFLISWALPDLEIHQTLNVGYKIIRKMFSLSEKCLKFHIKLRRLEHFVCSTHQLFFQVNWPNHSIVTHCENNEQEQRQLRIAHSPHAPIVEYRLSPIWKPIDQNIIIPRAANRTVLHGKFKIKPLICTYFQEKEKQNHCSKTDSTCIDYQHYSV